MNDNERNAIRDSTHRLRSRLTYIICALRALCVLCALCG
jgi:hypothetical protein